MTFGLKTILKQILLGTVVASALIAAPILTLSPGGAISGAADRQSVGGLPSPMT